MRFLYTLLVFLMACAHAPTAAAASRPKPSPIHSSPPPNAVLTQPWEMPELFDALNLHRRMAGAPALRIDRGLCAVAERATAEYRRLGRGAEPRVLALLNQDLQGFALTFDTTRAAVVIVEELQQAPQLLHAALDPSMAYAGLVIGPAPPPVGPRGGYSVVLALGR
jgi:hypothetical protein